MNLYQFMSDSPFLTFILAFIIAQTAISIVSALRGKTVHVECDCDEEDEEMEGVDGET